MFQDLMINPLSSPYRNYYAANPNNSLYNDALHLFNKNIKPNLHGDNSVDFMQNIIANLIANSLEQKGLKRNY